MGGSGSGRWYRYNKKTTVEESLELPLTPLRKGLNMVAAGQAAAWSGGLQWSLRGRVTSTISYRIERLGGAPVVRLLYTTKRLGADPIKSDYRVRVVWTRPHYGGRRWWWICPLLLGGRPCARRVGKLYSPPSSAYFGCRHCYDLTYTSCQESHKDDRFWQVLGQEVGWDWQAVRDLLHKRWER
jgi:hypothetical protein